MHETFRSAADRVSFDLTYGRSTERRRVYGTGITGGPLTNAEEGGADVAGDWQFPFAAEDDELRSDWIERLFTASVTEAVHEALEWFQVDGAPHLNPHGMKENAIYALCDEFTAKLHKLTADA